METSPSQSVASPSPWREAPAVVFWELTRACDLRCRHCRAEAVPDRHPDELSTEAVKRGLAALSEGGSAVVIFTGGDPFKRPDLAELVETCDREGLKPVLTPSATPLATRSRLEKLNEAGLRMIGLSLDGPDVSTHDVFRGQAGSFQHTLRLVDAVEELGIPLQINTTVCRRTLPRLGRIGERLGDWPIFRWALFFLVRTGDGRTLSPVDPEVIPGVFRDLQEWSNEHDVAVKTTNAPHFRRWRIEADERSRGPGMVEGDGVMFVSHRGDVYPSGFLQLACGNIQDEDPLTIYRDREPFVSIRARDLQGPCGDCSFKRTCGGSRAAAYAATGNPLASDPGCPYLSPDERDRIVGASGDSDD